MTATTTTNRPKKKSKRKFIIIGAIVLLLGVGFIIWKLNSNSQDSQVTMLPTFTVGYSDLSETISLSGNVKTVFLTEVNTKAEGVVKTVYVQNGDQVKQGDKLFEIELSPESKQTAQSKYNSYLNSQNSLSSAEASLWSAKSTLFNKNQYFIDHAVEEDLETDTPEYIMQESDWLNAEANYINQEEKISIARQAVNVAYLDYQQYQATVVAPASGEVSGIAVTEGMIISNTDDASQRLAVVKTGQSLLIQLDVSELDIGKVKVGQKANITLAATGDQVFEGEVLSIDQIGSNTSGTATYPVLVGFTVGDEVTILPNMSADVDLVISDQSQVLTVSTLAVQKDEEGNSYVDLVTSQSGRGENMTTTTEKRIVEIGTQTENLTEIVSGLNEGDQVQMNDFNAIFDTSGQTNMMMMGAPMMGGGGAVRVQTGGGGQRPSGGSGGSGGPP